MKNKILILHGWNASAREHWFPKAKEFFQKEGYHVEVPTLPGNYFPKKDEWLKVIENIVKEDGWILIGHSMGGVAILRFLEKSPYKAKQAILVATPFEPMSFKPIENFFDAPFDWQKIKQNCPKFDVINESDDPAVPFEHGKNFAKHLEGEFHQQIGFSHFHSFDLEFLKGLIQ